jgi:hypothetical protein
VIVHAVVAAFLSWCTISTVVPRPDLQPLTSRPIVTMAELPRVDLSPRQLADLQRWTREYADWKAWYTEWRNRSEPWWRKPHERRERPAPPLWLADACAASIDDKGPLVQGCRAFEEWTEHDDQAAIIAEKRDQLRAETEKPQKSVWWEHVHVDALWPMAQTGAKIYGVLGMHTTVHVTNRFQVFLTPGILLMRVPSAYDGQETWSAGTDWGVSYRVADFTMPGIKRKSMLHFNAARVWILSSSTIMPSQELYLVGFSLTFKPK